MKIGLEVHVQLPTRSKMFCPCPTSHSDEPNVNVCPTCLGLPGSRPSLNRAALEMGLKIARMLECEIPETTWFSRKTYFYPDLPKHFQTTQYETPVGGCGRYVMNGKTIRITRVHLEEDPGRTKRVGDGSSLIDYNRSGIPLVEIVTEPDISSPSEARAFLSELIAGIRHVIDIPEDGERSVRVDCNISVGKERCEVKNVTGLRNVEYALRYEAVRQTKILRAGGRVERETRRFDEERKVTLPARKKEFEEDYGYIGEPDLGVYHIKAMAEAVKLKETPAEMARRLSEDYGIGEGVARQMVNTSVRLGELFEDLARATDPETAVTWTTGTISANWRSLEGSLDGKREDIVSIVSAFRSGGATDTETAMRLKALITGKDAAVAAGSADLDALICGFLDANPSVIEDHRRNPKAINRVIGHVMREAPGRFSSRDVVEAAERLMALR